MILTMLSKLYGLTPGGCRKLMRRIPAEAQVVLYECEETVDFFCNLLREHGIPVFAICDPNASVCGTIRDGIPVRSLSEISSMAENPFFVILSYDFMPVRKLLADSGYKSDSMWSFTDGGRCVIALKNLEIPARVFLLNLYNRCIPSLCAAFGGLISLVSGNLRELMKLKDSHRGESCFIVMTGPSLTTGDLDWLEKQKIPSFSCNTVYNIFDRTIWRPDYYVVSDPAVNWDKLQNALRRETKPRPLLPLEAKGAVKLGHCLYFRQFYGSSGMCEKIKGLKSQMKLSSNLASGVYTTNSVVAVCFQIAVYMGFKNIYLLGADCSNSGAYSHAGDASDEANSYNFGANQRALDSMIESYFASYRLMEKYCRSHTVEVYNATRGGKLEIFKRIDMDGTVKNGLPKGAGAK